MNKYKEAKEDLKHLHNNGFESVHYEIVEPLLNRAIIKKPIKMETRTKDFYLRYCECDYELSPTLKMPFCENCGQALDWSND